MHGAPRRMWFGHEVVEIFDKYRIKIHRVYQIKHFLFLPLLIAHIKNEMILIFLGAFEKTDTSMLNF